MSEIADLFSLKGQTAMVTGASSGIGAHLAQTLAKAGANVVLCARRTDRLEALAAKIEAAGGNALAVVMDVKDDNTITAAFDTAEKAFGTVTVLLNNAGVADAKLTVNDTNESWDHVMDVNLKGVWRVAKEAAVRMMKAEVGGSIVNTASILGIGTQKGYVTYATAKSGVIHMTKTMALEWQKAGIRVNALCPGFFVTEINEHALDTDIGKATLLRSPAKRAGQLHELDTPVLMLTSPASSFVTGVALPVDGGHSVAMI